MSYEKHIVNCVSHVITITTERQQMWFLQLKSLRWFAIKIANVENIRIRFPVQSLVMFFSLSCNLKNFICKFYILIKEKIWYRKQNIIETLYRIFILYDYVRFVLSQLIKNWRYWALLFIHYHNSFVMKRQNAVTT